MDTRTPPPATAYHSLAMAIAVAVVVALGFGPTARERLLHSPTPIPGILHIHAAVFTSWVLLLLLQSGLVRVGRVVWHRRLGLLAVVLGTAMPFLGLATAIITTRIHRAEGDTGGDAFLIVSCFDMLAFAITFGLAVFWRRRPEYHRRLMVMASCGLTVAAFARLPDWLMPHNAWYLGVDALLLTAVLMDWAVLRRVHPVHRYGVPLLMVGQATAMWIYTTNAQFWLPIARALLA
jgi:hypothetical protein